MTPYSVRKGQIGILDAIGQSIAMNGPAATVSLYLVHSQRLPVTA